MLYSHEIDVQLETTHGTLHESSISVRSTSPKTLNLANKEEMVRGMKSLFDTQGFKLVAVAFKEQAIVDVLLP